MEERCRNCHYYHFGKCEKELPIEVELELFTEVDNGGLAWKIRNMLKENGLDLDEETLENITDDVERIVLNLSEDFELKVDEDFKCKYYE